MDDDVAWLERGWTWLAAHPTHPQHEALEAQWMTRLKQYEQAYRLVVERRHASWQ